MDKNAKDGADGIKMLTKEKALVMAEKTLHKFRQMKTDETKEYIKTNFQKTWDEHDLHGKNMIDVTEAY